MLCLYTCRWEGLGPGGTYTEAKVGREWFQHECWRYAAAVTIHPQWGGSEAQQTSGLIAEVWCLWTPVKVTFLFMFSDTKTGGNLRCMNIHIMWPFPALSCILIVALWPSVMPAFLDTFYVFWGYALLIIVFGSPSSAVCCMHTSITIFFTFGFSCTPSFLHCSDILDFHSTHSSQFSKY